ncbi:MAG: hypothetical protein HFG40_03640 [Bacilli bacterium]|nr:hypothetical protein [Bacilli bacterium]
MNANDKKGLWLVGFFLILLVGSLIAIRGCDKKELKDDRKDSNIVEPVPSPTPKTDELDNNSIVDSNTNIVVKKDYQVEKEQEKIIDLNQYLSQVDSMYKIAVGEQFTLPEIKLEEGVFLKIEYFFQELYGTSYQKVSDFSSSQPGMYKVVYTVRYGVWSTQKEISILVQDQEAPIIEGLIRREDPTTGITSYEPVKSGSKINQEIMLSFRDNHEVAYVEYYKAKYEIINNTATIEQDAMQEMIEVDFTQDLILYEDGEYHVRAYDVSGNVQEYIVTIDRSNPVVQVTYSRIDKNHTIVTITSQEDIRVISGWQLSQDQRHLTKIYENNQMEEVSVFDLAGNEVTVQIATTNVEVSIDVLQAGKKTTSVNLNTNDGDITVSMTSTPSMELVYAYEDGSFQTYNNQVLKTAGYYTFQAVLDGIVMDSVEFYISEQVVGD